MTIANPDFENFISTMWQDYCKFSPQARAVEDALEKDGESIVNDHIALRTVSHPLARIEKLSAVFEKYGYRCAHEYYFSEKELRAKHFEHDNKIYPKVFISELNLEKFPTQIADIFLKAFENLSPSYFDSELSLYGGRTWSASFKTYIDLQKHSEYAAWVYAHGFRPNHFTVLVNELKKYNDIRRLNSFLLSKGFPLNESGGQVKGSPEQFLEQSSTLANQIPVQFIEGNFIIPGCYYEFAKRYPLSDGNLFSGFVEKSADKIFESTNIRV